MAELATFILWTVDKLNIHRKTTSLTILMFRFTFESISFIAMDIRLGCLQQNIDPELARVFQATNQFLGMYPSITTI
jgi:hypothetical protein